MFVSKLGIAIVTTSFVVAAQAQTLDDKRCIFAAAEKLPSISGLTIAASRAKPAPVDVQSTWQLERDRYKGFVSSRSDAKAKPNIDTLLIEFDVKAAATGASFSFICFSASGFPPTVHQIGLMN